MKCADGRHLGNEFTLFALCSLRTRPFRTRRGMMEARREYDLDVAMCHISIFRRRSDPIGSLNPSNFETQCDASM